MKSVTEVAYESWRPSYWENSAKLVLSQLDQCAYDARDIYDNDVNDDEDDVDVDDGDDDDDDDGGFNSIVTPTGMAKLTMSICNKRTDWDVNVIPVCAVSICTHPVHDSPDRTSPVTAFIHIAPISVYSVYGVATI